MESEKLLSFLSIKLELWESYHNHKENMANAGFLVQLSLFGAVITEGLWPAKWVSTVIALPELATFIVYFLLWFLIHYYTRWQLINKRVAALYYSGFDHAFLYYLTNKLNEDDCQICSTETHAKSCIRDLFSKVFYVSGGFNKMDASLNGMPDFIARKIKEKFDAGTGSVILEILITYTSLLLMIIVGIKIFLAK